MIAAASSKPVLWTAAEAAAAAGGRAVGEWRATGVSIDSRTLEPGDLFVAIHGPTFDGHAFAADALGKGAAAAVVARVPEGVAQDAPLLIVDDPLEAMRQLGGAARDRTRARVIAVTGSVGKTGTKEALKMVLGRQSTTYANPGSLNNHWGVPLSLARLPADAAFGIFEMGMNHAGEISPLSALARPHVALITTIEPAHTEFFASVEEIADAKAEIFDGMNAAGTAVLNRDNRYFGRLAAAAEAAGVGNVVSFGADRRADVRLVEAAVEARGSEVTAAIDGETLSYRIGVAGRHWVINSLGILACVQAAGGDVVAAAHALADLEAPAGRGRTHRIVTSDGAIDVVDESYNASPAAMRAALEVLGRAEPGAGGRRLAVLGDMLELGAESAAQHAGLAGPLRDNRVDAVYTAGPEMAGLWEALPVRMRGGHAADSDALAPMVAAAVRGGDVVLVKGSAGSRMGRVVEALLALAGTASKRVVNGD